MVGKREVEIPPGRVVVQLPVSSSPGSVVHRHSLLYVVSAQSSMHYDVGELRRRRILIAEPLLESFPFIRSCNSGSRPEVRFGMGPRHR
jgi:hypothetical protein